MWRTIRLRMRLGGSRWLELDVGRQCWFACLWYKSTLEFRFRLGTIPVRVSGTFVFLVLVLCAQLQELDRIAIASVIFFASVLVHELGHALVGRRFGLVPEIHLYGMGGLTSWANRQEIGHWRSIAISLAGPFAGFLVALVIFLAQHFGLSPHGPRAAFAFDLALIINASWGVFNLAPMLPLDGGNVVRSALNLVTKGKGEKPARIISCVTGGLLAAFALLNGRLWLLGLALFFTWANVQAYRQGTKNVDAPLADAIEKSYAALNRHDGAEALALLRPTLLPEASAELRAIGLKLYCYALLLEGHWDELLASLHANAAIVGEEEIGRYAATARELGRLREGEWIEQLRAGLAPKVPRSANDFG